MRPANERWRYTVTPSLTGWVHTQTDLGVGVSGLPYLSATTDKYDLRMRNIHELYD